MFVVVHRAASPPYSPAISHDNITGELPLGQKELHHANSPKGMAQPVDGE